MAGPVVTVLIATRNRAEHIASSLTGVLESADQAPFETEVLIVNNGSNDNTDLVIKGFSEKWSILHTLNDPVAGKSGAINRALERVKGRAVIFTDDDVHVPKSWVADMASPILDGKADVVCGRVVLASQLDRSWLTPKLRVPLAEMLDVSGDLPGMVGANMATSIEAAKDIGLDEELGPGARGFADDTLFNLRLKAAGYRLIGCAGPPVEHHLTSDRLAYAELKSLAMRNGSSHAYLWRHWLHSDLRMLGLRRLRARAQLVWIRVRTPHDTPGITEREYDLWFAHSFYVHLGRERSQPRIYRTRASPGGSRPNSPPED
jgi:glycosyltransferase involved in cell wall biosynthesis